MDGDTQKFYASVDGKMPDDMDYASIFSKVIGHKLFNASSDDLYSSYRMNFVNDPVQTQYPHFMDMGILAIHALNESDFLGTSITSIQRLTYGYHWRAPDHVFGEATSVGMSAEKSDNEYSYKTDFGI